MAEDPGEIRQAIAQTREEMADTIQALGAKADLKHQAEGKLEDAKASAGELLAKVEAKVPEQARPALAAAEARTKSLAQRMRAAPGASAAIGGGVVLVLMVLRRRRRRRRAA